MDVVEPLEYGFPCDEFTKNIDKECYQSDKYILDILNILKYIKNLVTIEFSDNKKQNINLYELL